MSKSLVLADFGDGKCDKCDQDKDGLISLTFSDDAEGEPTTYTFCTECLENAMGDVVNDGTETQMLSMRAANA
jgi:hypothetical protein